jgi:Ca2+-binding EF-hand superfamily protein
MNKVQTKEFLVKFIDKGDHTLELSEAAFNEIFQIIDESKDGLIQREELAEFIKKFTSN